MRRLTQSLVFLALSCAACGDEAPTDIACLAFDCPSLLVPIPPPTSPENLALAIGVIFNDKTRTATERRVEYQRLFGPDFLLDCHVELDSCFVCPCQFFTIDGAAELFAAQESDEIYNLEMDLSIKAATNLDPPQPEREDWKMVLLPTIHFRVLFSPNDGQEVLAGEAMLLTYPSEGRWFIGEWTIRHHSPRAGAVTAATQSSYH